MHVIRGRSAFSSATPLPAWTRRDGRRPGSPSGQSPRIALSMLTHSSVPASPRFPSRARRWCPEPFDRRERHEWRCPVTPAVPPGGYAQCGPPPKTGQPRTRQRWRKEIPSVVQFLRECARLLLNRHLATGRLAASSRHDRPDRLAARTKPCVSSNRSSYAFFRGFSRAGRAWDAASVARGH
jgi:hypothetical protein